jgi:hypothetical protein
MPTLAAEHTRPHTNAEPVASHPARFRAFLNVTLQPLRGSESKVTGSGWRTTTERIAKDLENLNRRTEQDFLTVGEKLVKVRSAARQIASDMTALGELISGKQGQDASHALTRVLEHSKEMEARMERSGRTMEEVRDRSRKIRQAFSGLAQRVFVFRTLCTLTQIETSRLGNSGVDFGDLAAQVRPLSESIQSSGEGILCSSARLDQGVESAIRISSSLKVRQRNELPALISGAIGNLKAFEERRRRAAESSARQADQYGVVCDAIDGVVQSVQFHDITRQQIEHVEKALRDLNPRSKSQPNQADSLSSDTRSVLGRQASQLSGTAGVFASSVAAMERDLASIAERAEGTAGASRDLMGISPDAHDSFFLEMEKDFTAILNMLGACSAAERQMKSTSGELEEIILSMQNSVTEIRGVEIRIQRIAINATLRATHIGAAGDALNVIAGVMRSLALDSNNNTEEVAKVLDAMSEATRAPGDPSQLSDPVIDEMKRSIAELHAASESSFRGVEHIAALGARLAEEVNALRNGLGAGPIFAEVVDRALKELGRLGVHRQPLEGGGRATVTVKPKVTGVESGLGDNVELF